MSAFRTRFEVLEHLDCYISEVIDKYLKKVEEYWQPSDFLPNSLSKNFFNEVKELREKSKDLPYEFWVVLVGDTITEEALPTYESWLATLEGVRMSDATSNWTKWIRKWTAEENRHGDILSRYLYLSGQIDMKEVEISTQHLISDGFDIQTDTDPYKNFVYTSFQEIATNISHRRVATLAKKYDNPELAKMCALIAADEARHARAYKDFVTKIFEVDPSEMMLAFVDMMKKKIVMPAHFLRQSGEDIADTFQQFSVAAQRIGVYTRHDYIDILNDLLSDWNIGNIRDLNEQAEKARDYVMALPNRLKRVADRVSIEPPLEHYFKWVAPKLNIADNNLQ